MVVDADVIIRFLTNDDPQKASRFEKYLQTGNEVNLLDVTFAEIFWTLISFYKFKKEKVIFVLESLVNLSKIKANKELLLKTISVLKESKISFIDAYLCSWTQLKDDGKILSYDKGLDKLGFISRMEP